MAILAIEFLAIITWSTCSLILFFIATRDHTLFLEIPDVAFTKSSWTILSDVDLSSVLDASSYVEIHLNNQTRIGNRLSQSKNSNYRKLAGRDMLFDVDFLETSLLSFLGGAKNIFFEY